MSEVVSRDVPAGPAPGGPSASSAPEQPQSPPPPAAAGATAGELLADANLAARRFDVAAGSSVYEPATPARHLYLIHAGQVRVLLLTPGAKERSVRLLEILGPGDWFGAPALAGGSAYDTRALAVTAATLSEIAADRLFAALPQHPAVATTLIRSLGGKLQKAYAEAADLVFDDTNQRLIKTLLQFSRSVAASPQPAGEGEPSQGVELRITHQQLAQAIGAARETVSLALTSLRQKNLLRTGRNRLSFNPDALEGFYRSHGGKAEDAAAVQPQAGGARPAE